MSRTPGVKLEISYYRYHGLRQFMEIDNLREALEISRGDDCWVESILVDGIERWRRDPPDFCWKRTSGVA